MLSLLNLRHPRELMPTTSGREILHSTSIPIYIYYIYIWYYCQDNERYQQRQLSSLRNLELFLRADLLSIDWQYDVLSIDCRYDLLSRQQPIAASFPNIFVADNIYRQKPNFHSSIYIDTAVVCFSLVYGRKAISTVVPTDCSGC